MSIDTEFSKTFIRSEGENTIRLGERELRYILGVRIAIGLIIYLLPIIAYIL